MLKSTLLRNRNNNTIAVRQSGTFFRKLQETDNEIKMIPKGACDGLKY
jgi:hypothetical protein